MRKQAFFDAGYENRIEFQALGRVHGHQLDRILAGLRLIFPGFERGMGKKRGQGRHGLPVDGVGTAVRAIASRLRYYGSAIVPGASRRQIGRAWRRDRECKSVYNSVVAVCYNTKTYKQTTL